MKGKKNAPTDCVVCNEQSIELAKFLLSFLSNAQLYRKFIRKKKNLRSVPAVFIEGSYMIPIVCKIIWENIDISSLAMSIKWAILLLIVATKFSSFGYDICMADAIQAAAQNKPSNSYNLWKSISKIWTRVIKTKNNRVAKRNCPSFSLTRTKANAAGGWFYIPVFGIFGAGAGTRRRLY